MITKGEEGLQAVFAPKRPNWAQRRRSKGGSDLKVAGSACLPLGGGAFCHRFPRLFIIERSNQRFCTIFSYTFASTQWLGGGIVFLSWHAAKSFIKNLTLESFIPTSMLSINKKTMWLGVTSNASEVPNIRVDTGSWRHLPRHLVRFSHAFPLDSFSRAA